MNLTGQCSPAGGQTSQMRRFPDWLREWPLYLLLAIVGIVYFSRIEYPPLRGEETRRALVAINMQTSGDWVVPRMQGTPYFMSSRPPVHNWMIAGSMALRGSEDITSIRLPCLLAVALLSIILYGYARQSLSRVGAFATGLAYVTMIQVMELGRTGETDLPFTLFLSSALLFWHTGWQKQWSAWIIWPVAYLLLTGAIMTKGPQAPVYFAATIGLYLLINGRARFALSWAHVSGIALCASLISMWLVPFYLQLGVPGLRHVFTGDVVLYGGDRTIFTYLKHLTEFPISLVVGCWAPWSLLLINLCSKPWRQRMAPYHQAMLFAGLALVTSFPTVWLITGTRTRFLMSVYPLAAVLIGVTIETLYQWVKASKAVEPSLASASSNRQGNFSINPAPILPLSRFIGTFAILAWIAGGVMAVLTVATALSFPLGNLSVPPVYGIFLMMAAALLGRTMWVCRSTTTEARCIQGLAALGLFVGGTFVTAVVDDYTRRSSRIDLAVEKLLKELPEGAELVSLGEVHHNFEYQYYRRTGRFIRRIDPVPVQPRSLSSSIESAAGGASIDDNQRSITSRFSLEQLSGLTYLCTSYPRYLDREYLPVACEQVCVVACGRFLGKDPDMGVVVARLPVEHQLARESQNGTGLPAQNQDSSPPSGAIREPGAILPVSATEESIPK
ncbi:ArnT family glycosyltransferase [Planctopirus hydrillae]|uniref:Glycosyltransferase RgtA/B/C/D-like domain-containing protein n=1 Tax=Planctopirus hydrillae TaxID=1841610 RepID=A0A1C3E8Q4_9PLAN|nr:glycosyltransferase family 39 protein [Planctopirus hydrillae]ODA29622.1 hypothetical protein A6X21_08095 [Planctopirus hydrillae]